MSEVDDLKAALQAFLDLDWSPDAAPGPSYYLVSPVYVAREALVQASKLLHGKSYFPSDIDGSVFSYKTNGGEPKKMVWLGGRAYMEDRRDVVPEKYLAIFDEALK